MRNLKVFQLRSRISINKTMKKAFFYVFYWYFGKKTV